MKHVYLALVAVLLTAAMLIGCGGKAPSAAEKSAATAEKAAATAQKAAEQLAQQASAAKTPTAAAAKPAAMTAQPAAATAKPAAATAEPAAAEETFSVKSRNAGLEKLKTYRAQWRGEWKATESSATERVTWEWFEEVARESQAHHWGSKMADMTNNKVLDIEVWRIAEETYILTRDDAGKQECLFVANEAESSPFTAGLLSPNTFGGVSDAKYVGPATVNGIKTKHYKYDEKAATLAGFGKVSGEIWVAEDGGYVVKDTVSWQGAAGLFGSSGKATGAGTWTFEVLEVNRPLTITPPEICTKTKVDIPVMPAAQQTTRIGPALTYTVAASPADVAKFYQEKMKSAGWQLDGDPEIADDFASLNFTREGGTAQVTAMFADGKSQVMVSVSQE